ncbi:hypothetical protein TVAG_145680 [Trichomonas vaginalis G3]|uniref:Cadherin domain-containing protein n=1 Tax=Trichomonas vaginalis (strain ATCC PRA-98 / G3) TaxID=412133 RepID=A2EFT7_TRIV3|nr:hypothetical protein TVAGG3_0445380 [Trichomonas vaginalis G3]EAY08488.1 hypothetical protein TVAG_145680 [Trichomonas vaginalis G3]KAI5537755.1 hypothetical protein TVAGG3_0445380 [Trichomonas vaginalis G3]|eukprot:XP_001320711.1 hypothetical protein [Trichomonas vaginalis G3]
MILAFLSQLVASSLTLQDPVVQTNPFTGIKECGFFNYRYIFNGKSEILTYNDFGTYVKLIVNGTAFYPANQNAGDYNGITVHLQVENVTDDDDIYIKYIITNTYEYEARVQLGTFTDISFKGNDGNHNRITPLSDKKMYSIEHVQIAPTWQKMVMDYRDFKGKYIPPDNYWYGQTFDPENKYFMKFNNVNEINVLEASDDRNVDSYSSYSWNEKRIQGKQAIVLGIRLFFIMKTPFDFIATKKGFAGGMTGAIEAETYCRIFVEGRNYDAYYAINDSKDFKKLLSFPGTASSMDRYGFWIMPPDGAINTKYTMYLQYQEDGKTLQSNRIEFNITRSDQPSISLLSGDTLSKPFRGNESIPLEFTITSQRSVNVSFEVYRGKAMIHHDLKEFKFGAIGSNGATSKANFSLSKIPSGTFTLKVKVINDLGRESTYDETQFTVESDVYVQNVHFSQETYDPTEDIELIGWFTEMDLQQRVSFKLDVANGKGTSSNNDIKPLGTLQEFKIRMSIPSGLTKGVIPCTLTAIQEGLVFFSKNLSFILTDRPILSAKLLNGNTEEEYNNSFSLLYSLSAKDEGQCKFYYMFNGENETLITISDGHGNIPLTGLMYQGNDKYVLSIVAKDEYNSTSKPENYSFSIINKPYITKIEMKNISDPAKDVNVYVTYNDQDNEKQLYLYADYGNNVVLLKTLIPQSSGESDQKREGPFPYPNSGNYNIKFFLTSQKISNDYKSLPPNQISNLYEFPILSTKVPDVKLQVKTGKYYSSTSKIGFQLTVLDDMTGDIHYMIDGREDFDKGTAKPNYDAQQNHKNDQFSDEIPIPSWFKYWSNNSAHTFAVYVIDNYGIQSRSDSFDFYVINNPELSTFNMNKDYVLTQTKDKSDRTIHFYGDFNDHDDGKELNFYVKEGNMDKILAKTYYSGPKLNME